MLTRRELIAALGVLAIGPTSLVGQDRQKSDQATLETVTLTISGMT